MQEMRRVSLSILAALGLYLTPALGIAATDEEVAAAKRDAEYQGYLVEKSNAQKAAAEAQKAAAEAEKAAADAERARAEAAAAVPEAEARSRIATAEAEAKTQKAELEARKAIEDLRKAEFDAEKGRVEASKALLPTPPDTSKYKVEKPEEPKLNATAVYRNASVLLGDKGQSNGLANVLASSIRSSASKEQCTEGVKRTLLLENNKSRPAVALYKGTVFALDNAMDNVRTGTERLKRDHDRYKNNKLMPQQYSSGGLLLASNLVENALAYAKILKVQYASFTDAHTSSADDVVSSAVLGQLASTLHIVDPAAEWMGGAVLANKAENLVALLREARQVVDDVNESIQEEASKGAEAAKGETKSITVSAAGNAIGKSAKVLAALVDATDKQLVLLNTSASGEESPFVIAQKGEVLVNIMKNECTYMLSLNVISSDVDTVARDGLFSGFKVSMATNTLARWRLARPDGTLIASGVEQIYSPMKRVSLSD